MTLLSIPPLLVKFREGTCNGGWLMKSELVLQNKMGAALGQTLSSSTKVRGLSAHGWNRSQSPNSMRLRSQWLRLRS
jgi:hypothetical protein